MKDGYIRFFLVANRCAAFMLLLLLLAVPQRMYGQYKESNSFGNAQTFEGDVPVTWQTNGKGSVATTTYRKKQGRQSLLWTWEEGAKLIVSEPSIAASSYAPNIGMKLWIYSEAAIGDSIRIVIYNSSNQVECSLYYKINFKGWRGVWVKFIEDMGRNGRTTHLSRMEITAPAGVPSGKLWFDLFEVGYILYYRSVSHQFAPSHVTRNSFYVGDENQPYVYEKWFPQPFLPLPLQVSMEEQAELALIRKRIDDWLFGTALYANNPSCQSRVAAMNRYIASGVANFNKQNIVREADGRITGPGLFALFSDHDPKFGSDFAQNIMIPLALDYRLNGNAGSKDKLFLLFDYFHDQGWAYGSSIGTLKAEILRMVGWIYAVYLLKDELKREPWEAGKTKFDRETETMRWMTAFHTLFAPDDFLTEINVDDWRTSTLFRLILISMMDDDDPQKVQYMRHYKKWLDRNLAITYGWNDGIKPDGLGYHHRGPYLSAYSNNGVHTMAQIAWFLRHTAYDMSQPSKENIKSFLLNYRLITHLYDVPKGLSGRGKGFDVGASMIAPMAYMAQSMHPELIDTTLARAMMRLWNPSHEPVSSYIGSVNSSILYATTPGQVEAILDVAAMGFEPEPFPAGFWAKPYAAMALFRGNEWVVSVKGTSSYVWDFESAAKENEYGRYDSHGQMEIVNNIYPYPASWRSGHDYQNGWDWGKVPGTTSVDYPNSEITLPNFRTYAPKTTAGAVMHKNRNGVWAMEYEDKRYGSGLKFKKSIFFFGTNQMVCLGSDISSNEPSKTVTTLVQNVISSSNASFTINGMLMPPNYWFRPQNGYKIISNSLGLGIFVPDASNLQIIRSTQSSNTLNGGKSSSGDVFTAWFDNSSRSDYEYVVLMNAGDLALQQMRWTPNYEVVEQSSRAHIVKYLPDSITGFAIFDQTATFENSWIRKSSRPVFAMVEKRGADAYTLSLCDPDFNRPPLENTFASLQGPYSPTTLDLTLAGLWQLDGAYEFATQISATGDQSVIRFTCFDAQSYEVSLNHTPLTNAKDLTLPEIEIFPNPGNGIFNVSREISGAVFDLHGRMVLSVEASNRLDLKDYPAGIYLLKWGEEPGRSPIRIIKR